MDDRQAAQNQQLVTQWTGWLARGLKKKKRFNEAAKKVDAFFENDEHSHLFASPAVQRWLDVRGVLAQTVNLAFQIRGWMAPNLYHRNPVRTVTVRTRDSVLRAKAKVIQVYINYTPNECDLIGSSRAGIDEALLVGRGVLFTGWDNETGLVTSWQVSIDDVVIDPDARKVDEAKWIAFRRRAPLYTVKKQYKGAADGLEADRVSDLSAKDVEDTPSEVKVEGDESAEEAETGATCDVVTVWEIYSKMGRGWRGKGVPDEFKNNDDSKRFVKLDIVPGFERPLFDGPWDSKIHSDSAWPFTFLDLTPTRNRLWPVSLMAAGLPHQKSINLLASIWMEKVKRSARDIFGVRKDLPKKARQQIASGGLDEVIELGADDAAQDIRAIITKFKTGDISPAIERAIVKHEDWFAQTTGLLPILKGLSSEQQVRSATEADIKDKNARSRLGDLSERVEDWQSRAARNEGIILCDTAVVSVADVERIVGDEDLGWLVSWRNLHAEVPVRAPTNKPEPERGRDESLEAFNERLLAWERENFSLETIYPACADYYETEAEAKHHAARLLKALPVIDQIRRNSLPPRPGLFWTTLGTNPLVPEQPTVDVRRVTVADVWRDTRWLTPELIARELSYRVESGSTKRPDANKKITQAQFMTANVGQVARMVYERTGDPQQINGVLKASYDAMEIPDDNRVFMPPLPPPVMPEAQGPSEAGMGPPIQPSVGAA